MTRAVAGLVVLDVLYAIAGASFLHATRLVDVRRIRLGGVALAVVTGWALTGVALATLLLLGAPADVPAVVAVVAGLVAASLLLARRTRRSDDHKAREPRAWHDTAVATAGGAVIAIALLHALVHAVRQGPDRNWDVWAFWLAKAKTLVYFDGLDTGPGGLTTFPNPEYPLFAPATEAAAFAFMGDVAPAYIPIQHWVLTAAFVGGVVALLVRRVPAYALWPPLALLVVTPSFRSFATSALGDPQVAMVLALAAVCLLLYVLDRDTRLLPLAAVFLAAAALLKNEGLALGVVLAGVAAASLLGRSRRRDAGRLALLALVPPLAFAPWRLWLSVHDVHANPQVYDYGVLVRPAELVDRLSRLTFAVEEMVRLLLDPDRWLVLVPVFAITAVLLLAVRSRAGIVAAAWGVVALLALGSAYWLGTADLYWHVDTSASRVVTSVAAIAAATLPLLLAELARRTPGKAAPAAVGRGGAT